MLIFTTNHNNNSDRQSTLISFASPKSSLSSFLSVPLSSSPLHSPCSMFVFVFFLFFVFFLVFVFSFFFVFVFAWILKTLPKAQRTKGLSSAYQSNLFRSYHRFKHKSWSNFTFRISTKHQQNLNQTSVFPLNLNFKILTKPSLRISNKINLHNLNQTSAAKYWPNFSSKISPEPQLQNLDQSAGCPKKTQQ